MPENEDISRTPVFFLSYAHAHHQPGSKDPNDPVNKFFADLVEVVDQLTGLDPGAELAYMDRTMLGGTIWEDEVGSAVNSCQVFVALISAGYLTSEWCAREWHAFEQRDVRRMRPEAVSASSELVEERPTNATPLVPVQWSPVEGKLPDRVQQRQFFAPLTKDGPTAAKYAAEGVFGLMTMRETRAYHRVIWRLARHIVHTWHSFHVRPLESVPHRSSLRTSFRESDPE